MNWEHKLHFITFPIFFILLLPWSMLSFGETPHPKDSRFDNIAREWRCKWSADNDKVGGANH